MLEEAVKEKTTLCNSLLEGTGRIRDGGALAQEFHPPNDNIQTAASGWEAGPLTFD